MKLYLYIFLGGGAGSLIRFIVSTWLAGSINTFFPIGTLVINLTGSLLAGVLFEIFSNYMISAEMRSFLLIGFLGGFTTFSSFALENSNLLRTGENKFFLINIVTQNILSLALVFTGIILVRLAIKLFMR